MSSACRNCAKGVFGSACAEASSCGSQRGSRLNPAPSDAAKRRRGYKAAAFREFRPSRNAQEHHTTGCAPSPACKEASAVLTSSCDSQCTPAAACTPSVLSRAEAKAAQCSDSCNVPLTAALPDASSKEYMPFAPASKDLHPRQFAEMNALACSDGPHALQNFKLSSQCTGWDHNLAPNSYAIDWPFSWLAVHGDFAVHVMHRLFDVWLQLFQPGPKLALEDQILDQTQSRTQMLPHRPAAGGAYRPPFFGLRALRLTYQHCRLCTDPHAIANKVTDVLCWRRQHTSILSIYKHISSAMCSAKSGSRHWNTGCRASARLHSASNRSNALASSELAIWDTATA